MPESIAEFMERRRREIEELGRDAAVAAFDVYGKAKRTRDRLILSAADEIVQQGSRFIADRRRPEPRPQSSRPAARAANDARRVTVSQAQARPPNGRAGQSQGSRLDRSDLAKAIGGDVARLAGNAAGLVTGAANAAEGLVDGAIFVSRLADPLDYRKSPPGQTAADQVFNAGRGAVNYTSKVIADPSILTRDVRSKAHEMRLELDPTATPTSRTFSGELKRNFTIGQNQGELAVDVGSLAVGGPLAKGAGKLGAVSRATVGPEKYVAQGFSPTGAAYLAEIYSGMGHHNVPRRSRLPKILGGGPLPPAFSDGPFNVLKPEGMTRGDFYRLHFEVDDHFYGAKLPARVGGERWSGKKLGFEKHSTLGGIWHGTPAPMKARVGGSAASAGGLIYDLGEEDQ